MPVMYFSITGQFLPSGLISAIVILRKFINSVAAAGSTVQVGQCPATATASARFSRYFSFSDCCFSAAIAAPLVISNASATNIDLYFISLSFQLLGYKRVQDVER